MNIRIVWLNVSADFLVLVREKNSLQLGVGNVLVKGPVNIVFSHFFQDNTHCVIWAMICHMLIAYVLSHYIVNSKGCHCVSARCRYFSGKMSLKVRAGAAVWAVYASCCYCRPFSRILQFQSVKFEKSNPSDFIRINHTTSSKKLENEGWFSDWEYIQ